MHNLSDRSCIKLLSFDSVCYSLCFVYQVLGRVQQLVEEFSFQGLIIATLLFKSVSPRGAAIHLHLRLELTAGQAHR